MKKQLLRPIAMIVFVLTVATPVFAQRNLRIVNAAVTRGSSGTVAVQLQATGSENAFGFSINFDPSVLTFISAVTGSDVNGASLNVNANQAGSGRVGIALALPAGGATPAGSRALLSVTFNAKPGPSTTTQISFGDQPIAREISDATANALSATYTSGTITLTGNDNPPSPEIRKDLYLAIAGSVGVFRTDMRILNPSATKNIQVNAYFLPAGLGDNSGAQPVPILIRPREMAVLDDVVATTFGRTGLGAIRLTSDANFIATQRIYAVVQDGTVGQYVPGIANENAERNGVLIQLKTSGGSGQLGTYRTNIGLVNPNNASASVTWKLYDRSNAVVSTRTMQVPPYGVLSPTALSGGIFTGVSADLGDAWVSYTASRPLIAYASVLDNGTTDPVFVPMVEDTTNP